MTPAISIRSIAVSNNTASNRTALELAAAKVAMRSIEESIGTLEKIRDRAGFGSWLRPPTAW